LIREIDGMKTRFLDNHEKDIGRKQFFSYAFFNGLGSNFLGQTPVYLMAIHFGANNYQLSYISSIIFVSGFILLFLPRTLNGKDLLKVQNIVWTIRGLISCLYFFLLFLDGQAALSLILLIYTIFCLMRMVGATFKQPIQLMISSSRNRGYTVSQSAVSFFIGSLISQIISFLLTSFALFSGLYGLLGLQSLGIAANSKAVKSISVIPSRERIEYKKGYNIRKTFIDSIKRKDLRFALIIQVTGLLISILIGLTIPMLRKDYGFDTSLIFLFTITSTVANLIVSFLVKSFADITGNKPFLLLSTGGVIFTSFIWAFLPLKSTPAALVFTMGFICFFFLTNLLMTIPRQIIQTVKEEEKLSFNTMLQFVIAFFALLFSVFAGFIVGMGEKYKIFNFQHSYWIVFMAAALLTLFLFIYIYFYPQEDNYSVKKMLKLFFSFNDISVYRDISRMKKEKHEMKQKIILNHISLNKTRTATSEIQDILMHPLHMHREEAIRGLFLIPRPELQKRLMDIAADDRDFHRSHALFALGAYKNIEAEESLKNIYLNERGFIRSQAAKSLARIGKGIKFEDIFNDLEGSLSIIEKINYLIGLNRIDERFTYFKVINSPVLLNETEQGKKVILSLLAGFLPFQPPLSYFYHLDEYDRGRGIREFMEDTRDFDPLDTFYDDIIEKMDQKEYKSVISWIQNQIVFSEHKKSDNSILMAISTYDTNGADKVTSTAFLYLFYHLLHE